MVVIAPFFRGAAAAFSLVLLHVQKYTTPADYRHEVSKLLKNDGEQVQSFV